MTSKSLSQLPFLQSMVDAIGDVVLVVERSDGPARRVALLARVDAVYGDTNFRLPALSGGGLGLPSIRTVPPLHGACHAPQKPCPNCQLTDRNSRLPPDWRSYTKETKH